MNSRVQRMAQSLGLWAFRCPLCGTVSGQPGLCAACAHDLAPRTGGFCPRCGKRFGLESYAPMVCSDCRDAPPPWSRLYFHCPYDARIRDLILNYKFAAGIRHARLLQDLALEAYARGLAEGNGERAEVVVPVPLHWRRLVWRGFNQSLELARRLARREGLPLASRALKRLRHTTPQSTLGPLERLNNLSGAFAGDAALVRGRMVLLVDDVMTTGTTVRECAKALLDAGAAGVDVLVLART